LHEKRRVLAGEFGLPLDPDGIEIEFNEKQGGTLHHFGINGHSEKFTQPNLSC